MASQDDRGDPPRASQAKLGEKAADLVASMAREGSGARSAEPAESRAAPDVSSRRRAWILSAVFLAVAFSTVLMLVSRFLPQDRTIPEELLGTWTTAAPKYVDRPFEIMKDSLMFHTGGASFTVHPIVRVRKAESEEGILYTIDYTSFGKLYEFSFYHTEMPASVIRFKNQPQMDWRKANARGH